MKHAGEAESKTHYIFVWLPTAFFKLQDRLALALAALLECLNVTQPTVHFLPGTLC